MEDFEVKGRLESISFGLSFADVPHEEMRMKIVTLFVIVRTNLQLETAQVWYDSSALAPADNHETISARCRRSVPVPNTGV